MGFTRYLISEGDQALANHDGRGFAAIARRLSRRVGDPLRDELLGLALLGATRLDAVAQRWPALCADILARVDLAGT